MSLLENLFNYEETGFHHATDVFGSEDDMLGLLQYGPKPPKQEPLSFSVLSEYHEEEVMDCLPMPNSLKCMNTGFFNFMTNLEADRYGDQQKEEEHEEEEVDEDSDDEEDELSVPPPPPPAKKVVIEEEEEYRVPPPPLPEPTMNFVDERFTKMFEEYRKNHPIDMANLPPIPEKPSPPPEIITAYVRTKREGCEFIRALPPHMTTKPYKYEMRFVTTVPNASFEVSNQKIEMMIDNLSVGKFNGFLYEYVFDVSFKSRARGKDSREFTFEVYDKNGDFAGETESVEIRSKRSHKENEFWMRYNKNRKAFVKKRLNKRKRMDEQDSDSEEEMESIQPIRKKRKL